MTGHGCTYQLLPIKYELKLPSEVTPGLLPFRSRSKQCGRAIVGGLPITPAFKSPVLSAGTQLWLASLVRAPNWQIVFWLGVYCLTGYTPWKIFYIDLICAWGLVDYKKKIGRYKVSCYIFDELNREILGILGLKTSLWPSHIWQLFLFIICNWVSKGAGRNYN